MEVVYIAGCWDLFHIGHLNVLEKAKALGDVLVVGVNTDEFMMSHKGKSVIPFEQRIAIVRALRCVDIAIPHRDFKDLRGFKEYGVTIRAIGANHGKYEGERNHQVQLRELGIPIVVLPRTPNISTRQIREKCSELCRRNPSSGNVPQIS